MDLLLPLTAAPPPASVFAPLNLKVKGNTPHTSLVSSAPTSYLPPLHPLLLLLLLILPLLLCLGTIKKGTLMRGGLVLNHVRFAKKERKEERKRARYHIYQQQSHNIIG